MGFFASTRSTSFCTFTSRGSPTIESPESVEESNHALLIVAQFECSDIYLLVVCCFLWLLCARLVPFVLGLLCLEIQCYIESAKC